MEASEAQFNVKISNSPISIHMMESYGGEAKRDKDANVDDQRSSSTSPLKQNPSGS